MTADIATATTTPATRRATRAERAAYARWCTAYHEAGHAAAALVVGRRFRYVTIEPNPEGASLGHCEFTRTWPRGLDPATASPERLERYARKEILIALAGGAAEAQFRGRRNYGGAVGDHASAKTYARLATGCHEETDVGDDWCERCEWSKKSDCGIYLDALWLVAKQLVARETPAISALAEALLERETIRYAEACEIERSGERCVGILASQRSESRSSASPPAHSRCSSSR